MTSNQERNLGEVISFKYQIRRKHKIKLNVNQIELLKRTPLTILSTHRKVLLI